MTVDKQLMKIFEFSPERFKNPFVISGIIVAVIGMVLLFLLEKIIFKLLENKCINRYLSIDTQEELNNRVSNVKYKSKIIGKVISLILVFIGVILCLQGV